MSDLKYCQGTKCHTYLTQDRVKGTKGNKTNQTRRRSTMYYGKGNFCDRRCMEDWVDKYVDMALDQFGRITEAKHLTEENAWVKRFHYSWGGANGNSQHYFLNILTSEERPITEEQYEDRNYTLNIS